MSLAILLANHFAVDIASNVVSCIARVKRPWGRAAERSDADVSDHPSSHYEERASAPRALYPPAYLAARKGRQIPEAEILQTKCAMTVIGGEIVYEAK